MDDISNLSTSTIEKSGEVAEDHDVEFLLYSGERPNPTFQVGVAYPKVTSNMGFTGDLAPNVGARTNTTTEEDKNHSIVKCENPPPRAISKETLVSIIREWVKNDNEIREFKKQETIRKNANKALTARLIEIMRSNQLDCFDINDGCILYKKTNVKKPLSKKTLYQLLNEYYKDDLSKATEVSEFLMENREKVVKEKIVRKLNNPEEWSKATS